MASAVNLTSGAIAKIMTGKCTENDLRPVVQVTFAHRRGVWLSDGSFKEVGLIADELLISKDLQEGSIVQLNQFLLIKGLNSKGQIRSNIRVSDLTVIRSKCDIIGDPKLYPLHETPSVERTTPTIPDEDHANSHHVEEPPTSKQKLAHDIDIDDVEEPPTFIQNPLTSTQKCSSRIPTSKQKQDHVDSLLNEDIDDVKEPPTSIQNPSTSTQKCSSHFPTSKQKQDHVDPDLLENIDDNRHVEKPPTSKQKQDHVDLHKNIDGRCHGEEPLTSKQNTSASTQNCSFHSLTLNQTNTIMGVNLTPGAITKIMTDKCSSTDLRPVVQATNILIGRIRISNKKDKQFYRKVMLSDGSSSHFGCIIDDIFISNRLQKGSIIQLTKFRFTKFSTYGDKRVLVIDDLNVIHSKCDIIVNPEPFPCNDIPLLERSTPPVTDEDHVDVSQAQEHVTLTQNCSETQSKKRKDQSSNQTPEHDTNDDVHNSQNAQEPSATTQKCSSHSLTRSKKRKHQSSNDNITKVLEDVSKMTKMVIEKNRQDGVGACFNKLETLEEVVSKLTRMMMEKNKHDGVGACLEKLWILEENACKLTRMMIEKNKEDDVCACFKKLETLEKDISKVTMLVLALKSWRHLKKMFLNSHEW